MRSPFKRLLLAAMLATPLAAGTCQHVTYFASKAAIEVINLANAMGIDPLQASPAYLEQLSEACRGLTVAATMFDLTNEGRHMCSVALAAAAKADL